MRQFQPLWLAKTPFVLLIGAALVFGAIYYKTNKHRIDAWLERWRATLGRWE